MRFAMKPGVSFATTTPLPRRRSAKRTTVCRTSGRVSAVGITSRSGKYRGGLKKCVPSHLARKPALRGAAMSPSGRPDVFEDTMACSLACASTRSRSGCFPSSRSTTASMIQSLPRRAERSSKLPVRISACVSFVKNGSGCSERARSRPCRAASAVTSSSSVGTPAFARCAAICAPIVPAPRTVAFLIFNLIHLSLHISSYKGLPLSGQSANEEVDDRVCFRCERVPAATEDPVRGHLVERAEEDLGGERRVDLTLEHALRLALGNDVADDAEVFAEVRRREPLHELRRLPQLDLKDDGELPVAAQPLEVDARHAPQLLDWIVDPCDVLAPFGDRLIHRALEDGD